MPAERTGDKGHEKTANAPFDGFIRADSGVPVFPHKLPTKYAPESHKKTDSMIMMMPICESMGCEKCLKKDWNGS